MLAVVFWNSRRTNNEANSYESSLSEFHQALNANKPEGFRFSATYRVAVASGAIFALRKGAARLDGLSEANWLLKPRKVTVDNLIESTKAQLADGKCSLWRLA